MVDLIASSSFFISSCSGDPALLSLPKDSAVTAEMFPLLQRLVDRVALVSEDDVRSAIQLLAIGNKMVAEPSGALATAAALALPRSERGLSVCLVTGGNLNPSAFADIVTRGTPT